ncbi:hypothetical protein [Myroides sp. LJL119]
MANHPLINFESESKQVVICSNSKTLELDQNDAKNLANCISKAISDSDQAKHGVIIGGQTLKCRAKKNSDNKVIVHINLGKFHLLTSENPQELIKFLQDLTLESYQKL